MTIAMCAVMPEGIVLGADSTSSVFHDVHGFHYFNHNQKIFEVGENSTFGILTWGLGGLQDTSYRTIIARLDDDLRANPAPTVQDVADRWAALLWAAYGAAFPTEIAQIKALALKDPMGTSNSTSPHGCRTAAEEDEFQKIRQNLYVGFCVAGYTLPDRIPSAFELNFFPEAAAPPQPTRVNIGFWGAPNFILRLLNGWDDELKATLLQTGKWNGTEAELIDAMNKSALKVGISTLRDAIDFVYSSIHSTIKALKFSHLNQICGGPIELAVISTDRKFRWVRHKKWDSAITDGDIG